MAKSKPDQKQVVHALLDRHGQTFAQELGIHIEKNSPAPLFQLLCASLLLSARIASENATEATRALIKAKLNTAEKMAKASWQDRVDVITWHGYKRYDERGSTMLGDTAQMVLDKYRGDLRNLREEAGREVEREKKLLTQFKGIGGVGADIFLREVQGVWEEAYPYTDKRVLKAAQKLGLGSSAEELTKQVPRKQFPLLVAALVRTDLQKDYEDLRKAA
jgi:endonuclease III